MRVIGLGAGGHAKVLIEILQLLGDYEIVGVLDARTELHGTELTGIRVLGDDSLLAELRDRGVHHAFIGLGTVGDTQPRTRLYEKARSQGFQIVSAIHPRAFVSESVRMGHGPSVMASAVINAGTRIGDNVIVNTGAIVEHDCVIGDHVHVATGACLAGAVQIGQGSHIGLGALVKQRISIGNNVVVGAGAVVVKDVPDNVVVVGVPAKVRESIGN